MLQQMERWDESESIGSARLCFSAVNVSIQERRGQMAALLPKGCNAEVFHVLATLSAGAAGAFPFPRLPSQADRLSPLILPGACVCVFQKSKPRWRDLHFSKMLKQPKSGQTF